VFLVARVTGQIVGMLTVHGGALERMRHTGKLEIMVARSARRWGVGRALMSACVDWAEQSKIVLKLGLSVFTTNERAIALYREFGFVEEGRRPREYRMEDGTFREDVLMYRLITSR
jgi:ribosomal protein S18 acetylase RimI-like enzyme